MIVQIPVNGAIKRIMILIVIIAIIIIIKRTIIQKTIEYILNSIF